MLSLSDDNKWIKAVRQDGVRIAGIVRGHDGVWRLGAMNADELRELAGLMELLPQRKQKEGGD